MSSSSSDRSPVSYDPHDLFQNRYLFKLPGFENGFPTKLIMEEKSVAMFAAGSPGQSYVWIAWKSMLPETKEDCLKIALVPSFNETSMEKSLIEKEKLKFPYHVTVNVPRGGNTGIIHAKTIEVLYENKILDSKDVELKVVSETKQPYSKTILGGGLFKGKPIGGEPRLLKDFMNKSGILNGQSIAYHPHLIGALYFGDFEDNNELADPQEHEVLDSSDCSYNFFIERELPRQITHDIYDTVASHLAKHTGIPKPIKRKITSDHYAEEWWALNKDNHALINKKHMQSLLICLKIKDLDRIVAYKLMAFIINYVAKTFPNNPMEQSRELQRIMRTQYGDDLNTFLITLLKNACAIKRGALIEYMSPIISRLIQLGSDIFQQNRLGDSAISLALSDANPFLANEDQRGWTISPLFQGCRNILTKHILNNAHPLPISFQKFFYDRKDGEPIPPIENLSLYQRFVSEVLDLLIAHSWLQNSEFAAQVVLQSDLLSILTENQNVDHRLLATILTMPAPSDSLTKPILQQVVPLLKKPGATDALIDEFISYVSKIPRPAEQKSIIDSVLQGHNLFAKTLSFYTPQSTTFFESKPRGEAPLKKLQDKCLTMIRKDAKSTPKP